MVNARTGISGTRMTCREFERHAGKHLLLKSISLSWCSTHAHCCSIAGRELSKSPFTSIKAVKQDGTRMPLEKWIKQECHKLGQDLVGHQVAVWWPVENRYYEGIVSNYDRKKNCHHIDYFDSTMEDLWCAVESYKDLGNERQNYCTFAKTIAPQVLVCQLLVNSCCRCVYADYVSDWQTQVANIVAKRKQQPSRRHESRMTDSPREKPEQAATHSTSASSFGNPVPTPQLPVQGVTTELSLKPTSPIKPSPTRSPTPNLHMTAPSAALETPVVPVVAVVIEHHPVKPAAAVSAASDQQTDHNSTAEPQSTEQRSEHAPTEVVGDCALADDEVQSDGQTDGKQPEATLQTAIAGCPGGMLYMQPLSVCIQDPPESQVSTHSAITVDCLAVMAVSSPDQQFVLFHH